MRRRYEVFRFDPEPDRAPRFECTKARPKEIPVTKSINLIKREIERNR
ncbi:MAG: hypothetical protein KJ621_00035 [Proteobacteria bacterium]|nr:hypothetical protein [Pseudomonadota bacterium]MBU1742861.1 hypothetical protein [Pseudomonadota bacterium]